MIDIQKIREAHADEQIRPHSAGCYLWHPLCAIRVLADEVERLRGWTSCEEHGAPEFRKPKCVFCELLAREES